MESATSPASTTGIPSPHARLWRTLRWAYMFVLAAQVVAGLIAGFFAGHVFEDLLALSVVCPSIACVGLGIHLGIGLRLPISRVAVSIEALLAGVGCLVVGGFVAAFASAFAFGVQVDRAKSVGDAVIVEVRAFKDAHQRWPSSLAEAGIDERRLSDAHLELEWSEGAGGGRVDADGSQIPSIRFVHHPMGMLGATYRDADADTWTVWND